MTQMPSDDYVNIRQIGKGAFGTAHIVQHKVTGERFVLKRVRLARQTARERQSSVKELLLLSNLRHRNVLEFKGCWVEGGCNLCMLVELCESGDLFSQLRLRHPNNVHFSEEHLQEMAVQLLSALAYLHRSHIAHRDLKTANILITGDGCLKLADFGLSTVLEPESNHMTKTVVGTPNYMSPCVLQEKPYGTPNDVWGLGCVLFELSALKPAFQAFNMAGLIKKVTSGPPPPVPTCYSEHWRNLVRAMLTKEPDMRPSAEELLELDWLQPAVRRVAARFGPELPEGAADQLDRLSDLPPEIMALMDSFLAQERDEKRRQEEARERRKAAVMKWDPLVRAAVAAQAAAAAAAANRRPKLPPLKPHLARKALPRASRAPGAGGPPPRGVPPLGPCGTDGPSSPRPVDRAYPRRKTYCGEVGVGGCGGGDGVGGCGGDGATPRRVAAAPGGAAAVTGGGARTAATAWVRQGPVVVPPLPNCDCLRPQRQHRNGCYGGEVQGAEVAADTAEVAEQLPLSARLKGHRPSSAPPDSPVRRSRARAARDSTTTAGGAAAAADPAVNGFGLDGTTPPLGQKSLGTRRSSSCYGDVPSAGAAPGCIPGTVGSASTSERGASGTRCGTGAGEGAGGGMGKGGLAPLKDGQSAASGGGRGSGNGGLQAARVHDGDRPGGTAAARGAVEGQAGPAGLQVAGQKQQQQQYQQDARELVASAAAENSDSTFRYLPAVRNTSGLRRQGGSGSACSSGEESLGLYDDGDGDHDAGGGAADTECGKPGAKIARISSAVSLPRRSNSESVLQLTKTVLDEQKEQNERDERDAREPAGGVAPAAAGTASRGGQATSGTARGNINQWRPSDAVVPCRAVGGSAGAGGSRPATHDGQGASGGRAASGPSASQPRVGSANMGTRRPSGSAYGSTASGAAAAAATASAAAASQARVGSANADTRRQSGTAGGGANTAAAGSTRRLTLTNSGSVLASAAGPGPKAGAGAGQGRAAEGAPAKTRRPSAHAETLSSRPSSAAPERPSSAKATAQRKG